MRFITALRSISIAGCLVAAGWAQADTITSTLPAYTGKGITGNTETVGTFSFVLPEGQTILGATLEGLWGNAGSFTTAGQQISADGLLVATCVLNTACAQSKTADSASRLWSYTFGASDFATLQDGALTITDLQTGCCVIRLGETKLTIITSAVPEPSTYALMLGGIGAVACAARRRRING